MTKNYLFVGDLHGDLDAARQAIALAMADRAEIIQVGDWGFLWPGHDSTDRLDYLLREAGAVMRFIDGNHDDHPRLWSREQFASTPNLIYQSRGSVHEDEDGTRFLFLGGAPSIDRVHRTAGKSWWPEELPSDADRELAIAAAGPIHVLVSHDASNLPPGIPPAGDHTFRDASRQSLAHVRAVVDHHRPALHVHGHYHTRYSTWRVHPEGADTRVEGLDCNFSRAEQYCWAWRRSA